LTIVSHRRQSRTRDRRENNNNKHRRRCDSRARHHGDGDVRRMYIIIWYAHIMWYKVHVAAEHDNCTRTTRTRYYITLLLLIIIILWCCYIIPMYPVYVYLNTLCTSDYIILYYPLVYSLKNLYFNTSRYINIHHRWW